MTFPVVDIFLLIAFVLYLLISIFLTAKSAKKRANMLLAAISVSSAFWTIGIALFRIIPPDPEALFFFNKLFILASGVIASSFLHFSLVFSKRWDKPVLFRDVLIHLPNVIVLLCVNAPGVLIRDIVFQDWGRESVLGWGYLYFGVYIIGYFLVGLYFLNREYLRSVGKYKMQLGYIILATMITGSIDIYFNLILILMGNYKLIWIGPYSSFVWVAVLAYAITKHELMDIRVVITRAAAYGFVSTLLVSSFVALNWFQPPLFLAVAANAGLGLFWAYFAHRLREFIQTPLEEKWISGWYDPNKVLSRISLDLVPVLESEQAFLVIADGLKDGLKIKTVKIVVDQAELERLPEPVRRGEVRRLDDKVAIPLASSHSLKGALLLGPKISEDPYTEKDIMLFETVAVQALAILDRIQPYEKIKKDFEENQEKLYEAERQLDRSRRLASLGTLISGVTHEIRNPITVIRGKMENYFDKPRNEAYLRACRQTILNNVDRVEGIIQGMLDLARDKKERALSDVDLRQVIERSLEFSSLGKVKLVKDLQAVPLIKGVVGELEQVFINLIQNAVEAMARAGELTIRTYTEDGRAAVEVSDTGPGIAAKDREKIFDPFFSTRHEGVGLGLSIVYRIVREHGGDIKLTSQRGQGTTFKLTF